MPPTPPFYQEEKYSNYDVHPRNMSQEIYHQQTREKNKNVERENDYAHIYNFTCMYASFNEFMSRLSNVNFISFEVLEARLLLFVRCSWF
jgi:hypothetical protein